MVSSSSDSPLGERWIDVMEAAGAYAHNNSTAIGHTEMAQAMRR